MAHMATLRVDMGTSVRSWVMWAKNRLSAAAAIATQINPSTITVSGDQKLLSNGQVEIVD
jgi:hypothetical protein